MSSSPGQQDRTEWSAPSGEYRRVFRYGVMLVLAALVLTPVAGVTLGPSYPLLGMILAASIVGLGISAYLLLVQARATNSVPVAVLGAGFLYAAATLVPYTILDHGMFPGAGEAIGAGNAAHAYLWFFAQAGFLVALLAYQRLRLSESPPPPRAPGRVILALAAAYATITPIVIWLHALPDAYADGQWTAVFPWFMVPVIAALSLAVIVETIQRRHRTTLLEAWIALVALATIVELYLMLTGNGRFSLGWWMSRLVMLFATTSSLMVMLSRATRLYAELIVRAEVLEGEAHTDILTGLPNRRRFDEEFSRAFGSAIRRSSPIAVALIDIDRFKNYNDTFGHQAGDEALRRIAQAMGESVERSGDFAARYGGEEFVVILEDTTLTGAIGVAERIRNAVLEEGIRAPAGGLLSVSVGVAARLPGSTGDALLRQADAALYEAKNAGRNRVVAWRSADVTPIGSAFDDAPLVD